MLDQEIHPASVIVALPSEIDFTSHDRACDRLYAAFACGARVVIADFTSTAFCDVASLRRLVTIQRRAAAQDAQLRLVIPPGGLVYRLAGLIGLGQMLPVYPALREAIAAGTATMADIIDLLRLGQLHILRWQAWIGELGHSLGCAPPGPDLAASWDTVAALIDLHMRADDVICAPTLYDQTWQGRILDRESKDDHAEIDEMIGETSLQTPGTALWWRLATATLAAWSRQCDYENRGRRAQRRRHADPALLRQLGRQWRAFREAQIRDWSYPDAPTQLPTCQLRLARAATPRLADPSFCPLACTCQACDDKLASIRSA